jgi:glycosyltransferase involved in cell wall biosynthesis
VSPRRILLTTDVVGGVWDLCLTLATGLRACGDSVVLLAIGSPSAEQRRAASAAGAELISAPLKLEWMNDAAADIVRTPQVVADIARQVGADVVHANQFAAACAEVEVPVILTVHSDVLSWRRWTLGVCEVPAEWQPYHRLVRAAVDRAEAVVAVSRFLADALRALYGVERRIAVIHNGWPVSADSLAQVGSRQRATVVAGRIWDSAKNVSLVAEAALGWDPGPVYLAGEVAHPDGGQAHVPEPFTALGFLPRAELDALLRRCRLYLSPARYDPFGLLPLQAALHGCMLLLSDIPSYREVWGSSARFFRANDAADLRHQWQHLLDAPPDLAATAHARQHLSAERMVDDYRRLYAETRQAVLV